MSDQQPNAPMVAIVASTIRGCIQLVAGLGIAVGSYSDSQITLVASLLVGIATLLWSAYQKIQAARHSRATSVASANLSAEASANSGVPTAIVVTNPTAGATG